jgi:glycosyltransferase involved in cell wall biosynthesis
MSLMTLSEGLDEEFSGSTENVRLYKTPAADSRREEQQLLDITLFVACYNEQENILGTLNEIVAAMAELRLSWEIIVIDDASTDKSVDLVRGFMTGNPSLPVILAVRDKNKGLAQNFVDAAFLGNGKYYRLINGDNVESSRQIASILSHVGEADMLIPTHVQNRSRTLSRRLLSRLFTFAVNIVSGYSIYYYNGCTVHLRHDVQRWHSNCVGFDFQADLITRLLDQGKSYVEVQTVCSERAFGESKALTLRNVLSVFRFFVELVIRRTGNALK